jgi:hypothetical protein
MPDPGIQLQSEVVSLPMTLADGRPIVEVHINGSGPYRFILDTGAEGTILSKSLADSLKLPVLGQARVGAPGGQGTSDASLVRLDTLQLGDLTLTQAMAVAVDLSALPKVFSIPNAPVGALSIRNWKGMLVTLNYPESRIEIRRGELSAADDAEIFQFDSSDKLPSVAIDVAGVKLRANLDSGAARGVLLPGELQSRVPTTAAAVEVDGIRTMGGQSKTMRGTLNGAIKIGRFSISQPELNFVENFPMGDLGYPILRLFVVTLDWQNHRVRLQQPKKEQS